MTDEFDLLEQYPPPERLRGLDEDTLQLLGAQVREFVHTNGRDCPGDNCTLDDDQHELRPDWRRITLDGAGHAMVHNRPQLVRVELPPEGRTAKALGMPPPRRRRAARKAASPTSATSSTPPPPIHARNWHDDGFVWNPVVRDPATRNLGKLRVKVDHGKEVEVPEEVEPTPPPMPTFSAPPTPPAPPPTPAPPVRRMPSLDEAKARQARLARRAAPVQPELPLVNGTAKVEKDETLRRPRTLQRRLEELGAEVDIEPDGRRAQVRFRGYDIGAYKVKGFTQGGLSRSWTELSAKIERMR